MMSRNAARPIDALPRRFGQPAIGPDDRWPLPLATLAVLGLSLGGWIALVQGARALLALVG